MMENKIPYLIFFDIIKAIGEHFEDKCVLFCQNGKIDKNTKSKSFELVETNNRCKYRCVVRINKNGNIVEIRQIDITVIPHPVIRKMDINFNVINNGNVAE